jgi:hypothetical protein
MPPERKQDDPEQSKRFIEAARKVGADESKEGAARAFKKVTLKTDKKTKHRQSVR